MWSLQSSTFPIDSKPFGLSYGDWSARWWQWLLSIEKSSNPTIDPSGENAYINQIYPEVFFLCQTYEGVDVIPNRTVNIPSHKAVFLPVINWVSILNLDGKTENELLMNAKKRMDVVGNMQVIINGTSISKELAEYRAQSDFFDVTLPQDNIVGAPAGVTRAIGDGFWLFMRPLESSSQISTFGSCSSGVTKIAINYTINVKQ